MYMQGFYRVNLSAQLNLMHGAQAKQEPPLLMTFALEDFCLLF